MRDLLRNCTPFWYALYEGKTEKLDAHGNKTGQYEEHYAEPVKALAPISADSGVAEAEVFGTAVSYDRLISTVQNLPINEYSKIWIDADPTAGAPADYRVKRKAKSINQHLWALNREVR